MLLNVVITFLDGVKKENYTTIKNVKDLGNNEVEYIELPQGYTLENFESIKEDWEDIDLYTFNTTINTLSYMTESNGRLSIYKDFLVDSFDIEKIYEEVLNEFKKEQPNVYLKYKD